MPKYSVLLEGENFSILQDEGSQLFGFYATRKVKAKDEFEAGLLAINLVKEDETLLDNIDPKSNIESLVKVDNISILKWWNRLNASGFTFFRMDE
jgi:hypothetical protein